MDISELYGNLPGTDLSEEIDNLKNQNNLLQEHIQSLESDVEKLCSKITQMKSVQTNLTKNISELFKTAKAEIDRKDRMVNDLRSKLEESETQRNSLSVALKRQKEFSATNKHLQNHQQPHHNMSWSNKNINWKPENSSPLPRGQSENQPHLRDQQNQYKNNHFRGRNRFHPANKYEPQDFDVNNSRNLARHNIKETLPRKTVSKHQVEERIEKSAGKVDVKLTKLVSPAEKCKAKLPNSGFAIEKQPNKAGVENTSNKMRNDNNVVNVEEPVKPDIKPIEENCLNLNGKNIETKHTEISSTLKSNESTINKKKHQLSSNSSKRHRNLEEVAQSLLKLHEIETSEKDICSGIVIYDSATETEQNEAKCFTESANRTVLSTDTTNAKEETLIKSLIVNEVIIKNGKQLVDHENSFNSQEPMEVDGETCPEKIDDKVHKKYESSTGDVKHNRVLKRIQKRDRSSADVESLVKEESHVEDVSLKKQASPSKKDKVISPKLERIRPEKEFSSRVENLSTKKVDETDVLRALQQKGALNTSSNKELVSSHACENQPLQVLTEKFPLAKLNANSKNIVSESLIRASNCGRASSFSPLKKRKRVIFSMID